MLVSVGTFRRVKYPSVLLEVPIVVPLTIILAPGSASPEVLSRIVPVRVKLKSTGLPKNVFFAFSKIISSSISFGCVMN